MSESKKIAKNTLFLYVRMLFNMGVSLYTSRVILRTLGVEDFGTYNLVAGVVILFTFLNAPMVITTQRFINVEKVSKIVKNVNRIFNISLSVHVIISLIILLLAETVGLWFLNYKLNIPAERMYAANFVFQMSILTTVIDVMRVPFNAMIIAYERMSYYAFLGIFETIAKLVIVYLLVVFPSFDKLVLYSFLLMLVNLITNFIFYTYCKKNFKEETAFKRYNDTARVKELLSFSGWMLFGQLAVMGATQGLNMILNIFNGVIVNAALGIATQVNSALYSFITNFQVAFNPQIVQSYASGEYERNKKMVLATSKYSLFLMALISAPVLFFTKAILTLWLGNNLPAYVEGFVQVTIFCSLTDALAGPFWMSAQAIGNIKEYNIIMTTVNFFTLPLAWLLLKLGYSPVYVFVSKFAIYTFLLLLKYYIINKYLQFDWKQFGAYLLRVVEIFAFFGLILVFKNSGKATFFQIVWEAALVELLLLAIILLIGLEKEERNLMWDFLKKKLNTQ
ncbi:MAG: oligosaccharide flippase family protein [Bacteroidota bacterium]